MRSVGWVAVYFVSPQERAMSSGAGIVVYGSAGELLHRVSPQKLVVQSDGDACARFKDPSIPVTNLGLI